MSRKLSYLSSYGLAESEIGFVEAMLTHGKLRIRRDSQFQLLKASIRKMQEWTGCPRATVFRATRRLCERGLLAIIRRRSRPSTYVLHVDRLNSLAPIDEEAFDPELLFSRQFDPTAFVPKSGKKTGRSNNRDRVSSDKTSPPGRPSSRDKQREYVRETCRRHHEVTYAVLLAGFNREYKQDITTEKLKPATLMSIKQVCSELNLTYKDRGIR